MEGKNSSDQEIEINFPSSTTKTNTKTKTGSEITILPMIRYRECQRNHAAHLGAHVVDGCGEFMAAGDDSTPLSLKCAACDCHRNFHRREVAGETPTTTHPLPPTPTLHPPRPPPPATANCYISFNTPKPKPQPQKLHPTIRPHHRAPVMMGFGGGGAAVESSSEELNKMAGVSKKRYRTKFSQDQKEKMMEFAEKIGWRMQKQDDDEVQRFCNQVGVKRRVFKVWLHNNKQAMKRKQS